MQGVQVMRYGMILGVTLGALAGLATTPASAADYRGGARASAYGRNQDMVRDRPYTGRLPACEDPAVHSKVAGAFAETERVYWRSQLQLTTFQRPREIGYRTWGYAFVPRRFCSARTVTTDGHKREVVYNIAEAQGFAGVGWGVEWCVSGLDRPRAYSPGCKMARP